jgi:hypothetical protein
MKVKKISENLDTNLDFGLTDEQKLSISELFEKVMNKYELKSNIGKDSIYFSGVTDGINHCYKIINGISDDYLDDI